MSIDPARVAAFHVLPSVTPRVLRAVLIDQRLSDYESWRAADLVTWGIDQARAERIMRDLPHLNQPAAQAIINQFRISIIRRDDPLYPPYLQSIAQPPDVLYIRGRTEALHCPGIAIVGTRQPSPYGERQAFMIARGLAQAGLCIYSGLAHGIDGIAHRAALKARGTTVAVMGTGVEQIYPWGHQRLAEEIVAQGGAIISELPFGTEPERHHFPRRNRIIAGLAQAVWLVEAAQRSGALITMKYGLEENRDLYALPGDVHRDTSQGPLNWLRLGAAIGACVEDFRATWPRLNASTGPVSPPVSINADERMILDQLSPSDSRHIDEIVETCRLEASVIATTLALLEVRGLVRHHGDMRYTRLT